MPPMDQAYSALLEDLAAARPARRDAGGLDGRVRPHAEDQRRRRPRPLGPRLLGGPGRRRRARRAGDRRLRRIGGHPRDGRVQPQDLTATVFHCLGYPPHTEIHDTLGRPLPISRGEVIRQAV